MASIKVGVVVGVVLQQGGKILLVQQSKPAAYGLWGFPGGQIEEGESFEDAAIREAQEESGYSVALDHPLATFHFGPNQPVFHPFSAHITGGELKIAHNEILDARWFTPAEVRDMSGQP
jgi:ADP-ribose pyrophosphatase YjhB (NUDIX family)